MGLRETKKSTLKLGILEAMLDMLKHKPFEKIKVVDICHDVKTSEVTFYKYFSRKEEILQYFMLVWEYKRTWRLKNEGYKKGLSGIYAIFQDISQTDNALGIMTALISFIASQRDKPANISLSTFDKEVILQESVKFEKEETLEEQMARHIQEAVECGEICEDVHIDELIKVLSGIFYGVPLITHATAGSDLFGDYKTSLDYVFNSITKNRRYSICK